MSCVTRVNESCHTRELWVKLHIWMVRVPIKCVMCTWLIHMCNLTHSYVWHESSYTFEWYTFEWSALDIDHLNLRVQKEIINWLIRMRHVTHLNKSRHTCECVTSRTWMSHVTHVNESCHTCEWVMSQMWMSHVTHVNESCHTPAPDIDHSNLRVQKDTINWLNWLRSDLGFDSFRA